MLLTNVVARSPRVERRRLFVLVAVLMLVLALAACGRRMAVVEVEMTPVAGGMVTPAEAGVDRVIDADAGDVQASDGAALLVGQRVTITAPQGATLRGDATDGALILQQLFVGEVLDVVEASGAYESYPVTVDGQEWVRVRAADGLVGWLPLDTLTRAE